MAQIVGGIATSHIPSIGKAIARGLYDDPYWKDFFAGYQPAHEWLDRMKPDVAVVIYNDHGLNFFLDKMPTFAIGAARNIEMRTRAGDFPSRRRSRAIPNCRGT